MLSVGHQFTHEDNGGARLPEGQSTYSC